MLLLLKRGKHDKQLMFHFVIKYRSGLEIENLEQSAIKY